MTAPWKIASYGASKRHWFIIRGFGEAANDRGGKPRRFAEPVAAQRAADKLNGATS